jgi:hypothetical protein
VKTSISVELKHKKLDFAFSAVNIYGPSSDRVLFWEELKNTRVFSDPILIVGRDLNFTLSLREVWGLNPREDRQRGFFFSFMELSNLVDLEPVKLAATWRSVRARE